jgi:(2Fe-2S) ferredoxin
MTDTSPHPLPFYDKHVFICTTDVGDPHCCGAKGSADMRMHMMKRLDDLKLTGYGRVRVTKAGCMARCRNGASLVIYPDNVWYSPKNNDDIDTIINEHLVGGRLIERLLMPETEVELKD